MIELLFILQAATSAPPPVIIVPTYPMPARKVAPLPATAMPVVQHIDALFRGDIDGALRWVSPSVENTVSQPKSSEKQANVRFPDGVMVAKAMYYSMTHSGKLMLSHFECEPAGTWVSCQMLFGTGTSARRFTVGYLPSGDKIAKINSWENHELR